jgi:lipoprotein NlpI
MQGWMICLSLGLFLLLAVPAAGQADDPLQQAGDALKKGDAKEALALAGKAVTADPKSSAARLLRGRAHAALDQHADAVADFTRVLELDPKAADAFQLRGSEQFKLGRIRESIADFDRYLELHPEKKAGHWQRGISYYYAGRYKEGQEQFEGYQTTDANDVENVTWRYLCQAKRLGVEKARADLLKVGPDKRVPMKEIYGLFKGDVRPEAVLAAARAGEPPADRLKEQLFYAHLYLGLWYDAQGDRKQALTHVSAATDDYHIGHYMWYLARVHRDRLRKEK